ncbi:MULTISPECIES: DNA methyltransferase [unclassified Burkholderia]|uniref:DNA methyltransferase n=1 Tax=Burkholderia sp. MSMB1588 TaxID=1636423 RepID=UPI0007534638|nr:MULTISPECIES: DNA methyltransferase [unclassified Burkholderia]KVN20693.1 DNA methyltransferase [Burkholderia sp. MSMB1552]KWZ46975.1 DNA methyltransferase [Burkholderia sp. MSMB1588]
MRDWIDHCHFGNCRELMRVMIADGVKVQTIVTSPPYWGLRDYGVDGQIGRESTLCEFIDTLVEVFDLARQLLADDGTAWVNMGDSYAGSRGGGAPSVTSTLAGNGHVGGGPKLRGITAGRRRDDAPVPRSDVRVEVLKPKDLVGQPWRLAFALQDAGWYLRQDIVWCLSGGAWAYRFKSGPPTRPEHDVLENFMPACAPCNIDKHAMPLEAWRAKLSRTLDVLNRSYPTYRHARRFGLLTETPAPIIFYFERVAADAGGAGASR